MKPKLKLILFFIIGFTQCLPAQIYLLTANPPGNSEYFGKAVALDDNLVVVGAPNEGIYATTPEAAHIFEWNGTTWTLLKKLTNPDDRDEQFGAAVAIDGDIVAVGTPYKYITTNSQGCVYIYYRDQGGANNWGLVKQIVPADVASGDKFGTSVALDGDILVVGSPSNSESASLGGAVYVFYKNQGGIDNWGLVKKLTASDAEDSDYLGQAVDVYGEYLIAGAYGKNAKGAAYIFYRNLGGEDNWGEFKKLVPSDLTYPDKFGWSASIYGDYAVVGTPAHKANGSDVCGAAYTFARNLGGADNWGLQQKFLPDDIEDVAQFGYSVSIFQKFLVIGSPRNDLGDTDGGAIFAYLLSNDDSWNLTRHTSSPTPNKDDYFGFSVSVGQTFTVSGVPYDDVNDEGANQGVAYVYDNAGALGLNDASLPVTLQQFNAISGDGKVTLHWTTQSEVNNQAFIIERGMDSLTFSFLAEIKGQGFKSSKTHYSFIDRSVQNGQVYFYRLADRDFSGRLFYHAVVKARPQARSSKDDPTFATIEKFHLYPAFPNPFNPQTHIAFDVPQGQQGTIELNIFDLQGRKIKTLCKQSGSKAGHFELVWHGTDDADQQVSAGLYFVILRSSAYFSTQKLILLR